MASEMPMEDWIEILDAEGDREAIAEGATVLDVREPNEDEAGRPLRHGPSHSTGV